MIKQLPGWANYFLLFGIYSGLGFLLRWMSGSKCETWFVLLMMAVYAGGYLAKWRFYNGKWRFN